MATLARSTEISINNWSPSSKICIVKAVLSLLKLSDQLNAIIDVTGVIHDALVGKDNPVRHIKQAANEVGLAISYLAERQGAIRGSVNEMAEKIGESGEDFAAMSTRLDRALEQAEQFAREVNLLSYHIRVDLSRDLERQTDELREELAEAKRALGTQSTENKEEVIQMIDRVHHHLGNVVVRESDLQRGDVKALRGDLESSGTRLGTGYRRFEDTIVAAGQGAFAKSKLGVSRAKNLVRSRSGAADDETTSYAD